MKTSLKLLGALGGLLMSLSAMAATFVEGKDYVRVEGFSESHTPVLREFFSYNCPHCFRMDHTIEEAVGLVAKEVRFERTPVGAGRNPWQMSQLAYYLAQKFNVTDQTHGAIFKQVQEVAPFQSEADVRQFFVSQGLKADELDKAIASSDRKLAMMTFDTEAQLSGIRGVPSLLVNGKYMLNIQGRSSAEIAELVQYLVKQ
ncbi:thiol:disulfide interchange protein DsbA/DsbL [Shewanella amazonensis]